MAQVRSGQDTAHASSRSACAPQARTRTSPSGSSAALITTAVCEALCGSTPIITAAMTCPPRPDLGEPWRARLIPELRAGARASFEPRHGEAPASWHVVRKPDPKPGRQAAQEPVPPGPLNATDLAHCHPGQVRNAYAQSGGSASAGCIGDVYRSAGFCAAGCRGAAGPALRPGAPSRRLSDGDDDLAFGVPFAEISQCRWHLTERNATIDHGGDLSSLA